MNRVAVVTGSGAGIGEATADLLEERGWNVVGVARRPTGKDRDLLLDVSDHEEVLEQLGRLERVDALVNNAAIQMFKGTDELTVEDWDQVLAVNLRGPFVCLKAVREQLIASGGAVVNVSSVHASATSASTAAYAASKGGLVAFTRAAALELGPLGVRVNVLSPGAVATKALDAGLERGDGAEENLVARTPLGRIGQPREIAEAVSFLVDPEKAGFITGQELVVDGGALALLGTE